MKFNYLCGQYKMEHGKTAPAHQARHTAQPANGETTEGEDGFGENREPEDDEPEDGEAGGSKMDRGTRCTRAKAVSDQVCEELLLG